MWRRTAMAAWLLQGCGAGTGSDVSADRPTPVVVTSFEDWCLGWGLTCPAAPPANVPTAEAPWSKEQWSALLFSIKAITEGPSDIRLSRAEMDDPNLKKVFDLAGIGDVLAQIKTRLDASSLKEMRFAAGAFSITAERAGEFRSPSGLIIRNQPNVSIRIGERAAVETTGMGLGSAYGASETLKSYIVTSKNVMEWHATTDKKFVDVPIQFLLQELMGIELGSSGGGTAPGFKDLMPALLPLNDWLTSGQRDLDLTRETFQALARNLPMLTADPARKTLMEHILGRLSKVVSTTASRGEKLVQGEATSEINCKMGNEAMLTIEARFGISRITKVTDRKVRVELYGFRVKPLRGIARPTIHLDKMDVEPTKLTIHNVPVIGTYTVDMEDPDNKQMKVTCGGSGV